jgi:hypothetical protein
MGYISDYYVYVYIDPRNNEEFYFGKGKGSRKESHRFDNSDSEKTRRIAAIKKENLEPIVRVIARGLNESEALLVEKTLLWKLGKHLTNISSGHFSDKFRPHNSLHKELTGFDFESSIYYYNVGEGKHRNWDDYVDFGFISAGQGVRWRDAMLGFREGDIVAAYLRRKGFVGIGKLTSPARPIREVMLNDKPLLSHTLRCAGMNDNLESDDLCEYVATVDWKSVVRRGDAKWKKLSDLFTTQLVRASLDAQPKTIAFLEEEFDLNIRDLVR